MERETSVNTSMELPLGDLNLSTWTFECYGLLLYHAVKNVYYCFTVVFQITFCPTSAKYFKEEVVFVCDNCHVKEFSIEGEQTVLKILQNYFNYMYKKINT